MQPEHQIAWRQFVTTLPEAFADDAFDGVARDGQRRHSLGDHHAQAREFREATDVTGVVLTKLDGSAKGGIVFAIETELGIPVKLVGIGEQIADLVPFQPGEFVAALFEGN